MLVPRGVIAIWGYARIFVNAEIDPVLQWFEYERVGDYWPPGRDIARNEYRDITLPFPRIDTPAFVMRRSWTVADMLGMLSSTSAVARYRHQVGADPLPDVARRLEPLWGSARREVRWPIHMLAGRHE